MPLGSPPRWCRVGQQYALYNPLNGATHFLQESAYETVQALVQQPMTMTALMACLGLDEAREEAEAQVVQSGLLRLLWELDNLGIIAPLPC
ncbi:hypothetical protein Mmc1_0593 [Magnetococcus marinus MC-1]|uniref:HPr-rel-A system PqqD family protein n=1 Tax=Magnetococcus marinus (strain ATCC BAA-1437 / JCM 17883 / MC-1) TaxID=156889 RepID=A0L571_MAGMM|nr:hypothetical protein Mmc1_0593 [Magnetococcus marinus MC-1]